MTPSSRLERVLWRWILFLRLEQRMFWGDLVVVGDWLVECPSNGKFWRSRVHPPRWVFMFFAQRELAVNPPADVILWRQRGVVLPSWRDAWTPPADVILEPPNCRARWLGHFFLFYLFIFFVMLEPPSCRARWLGHFIYLFISFFLGGGVVPTRET